MAPAQDLEVDYLLVGAGAVGLSFADALVAGDAGATIAIADRRAAPGGHWVDGYGFLRLHTSSTYYGVDSMPLGAGGRVPGGRDRGQQERASGAEVREYFGQVMQRLLATGRVHYLPRTEHVGDGVLQSLDGGSSQRIAVRRKIAEATYADTRLPATEPPPFPVAEGVKLVTPGELPGVLAPEARFVIVGGGKTAMDTAVWLLDAGVPPERVTWIRPREAWLLNRDRLQTDEASFEATFGGFAAEMEAARDATSVADLFRRLEAAGQVQRIDAGIEPTMYRCATVSEAELAALRRVTDVVRLGRVLRVERERAVLERGTLELSPRHVLVHCCADGIPQHPAQPMFQGRRLLVQYVRRCSPSFSAAMVARIELTLATDEEKNAVSLSVPVPLVPMDWLRMLLEESRNAASWAGYPALRDWASRTRLNPLAALAARGMKDPARAAILGRYRSAYGPGLKNLERLMREASLA